MSFEATNALPGLCPTGVLTKVHVKNVHGSIVETQFWMKMQDTEL